MIFLLLLPVLAAGYFISVHHPYVRLSSAREEGQRLYLRSVSLGFASLALGGVIAFIFSQLLPRYVTISVSELPNGAVLAEYVFPLDLVNYLAEAMIESGMHKSSGAKQSAWLVLLSGASLIGAGLIVLHAYLWCGLRARVFHITKDSDAHQERLPRRFFTWIKAAKARIKLDITAELLEQSPLDRILFRVQMTKVPLQFWMRNRKIYVGFVVDCAEPFTTTGTGKEVTIVPVISGYQNEKDLRVQFTTFYHEQDIEIELILRQDEIISVSEFYWEAAESLQSKERKLALRSSDHE
jgi:hypothetical protein